MSESETADGDLWNEAGFIVSSKYRQAVLGRLAHGPATPTAIGDDVDYAVTHVSRALRAMRDRGIVELLVPEEKHKGRIYGITDHGEDVADRVDSMEPRGGA